MLKLIQSTNVLLDKPSKYTHTHRYTVTSLLPAENKKQKLVVLFLSKLTTYRDGHVKIAEPKQS